MKPCSETGARSPSEPTAAVRRVASGSWRHWRRKGRPSVRLRSAICSMKRARFAAGPFSAWARMVAETPGPLRRARLVRASLAVSRFSPELRSARSVTNAASPGRSPTALIAAARTDASVCWVAATIALVAAASGRREKAVITAAWVGTSQDGSWAARAAARPGARELAIASMAACLGVQSGPVRTATRRAAAPAGSRSSRPRRALARWCGAALVSPRSSVRRATPSVVGSLRAAVSLASNRPKTVAGAVRSAASAAALPI